MAAHTVSINNDELTFQVSYGTSLLQALRDNGLYIPSVCNGSAQCGYCRIMVPSGGGELTSEEESLLTPDERKRNTRLACRVSVEQDVTVKIPRQMLKARRFRGVVESKTLLTYDIAGLRIKLLDPLAMEFVAGQYVKLETRLYADRAAVLRNYSIASVPSRPGSIDLCVRKVPNGIATTWVFDHLQAGDEVDFAGPYGSLHIQPTQAPMVFIAGGSGLGPLLSMIRSLCESGNRRMAHCFFGALTQKDLYYSQELAQIESSCSWFSYTAALSKEPEGSDWQGERGLITDVVARHIPDASAYEAYLCGSPGMIEACLAVLKAAGIRSNAIYFDKFV